MDNVVEYNRRGAITSASVGSGGGGGGVDDILKRLSSVETSVADVRIQVGAILAMIPHLATKAELADVKTAVMSMETAIIKWIIATVLTTAALAFAIAKFVH